MPDTSAHEAMSKDMAQCAQECLTCHSICLTTVQHCLEKGGKHATPGHIRTLMDCAEICRTSASFLLRGSRFHARTCAVCAEVCRACEESCRAIGDDAMMQQCAEACRRCAESCQRMGKMAA